MSPSIHFAIFVWGIAGFALLVIDSFVRKRRAAARAKVQDINALPPAASAGPAVGTLVGVGGATIAFFTFFLVASAKRWTLADLYSASLFTQVAIVFVGIVVAGWANRRSVIAAVASCAIVAFGAGLYWISHEFRDRNPDGMEKAFRDMFVVVFAMPSAVGLGAACWLLVIQWRDRNTR